MKKMAHVNVQVNSKLLQLVQSMEEDISKAVGEALHLWLKEKIITCPITNKLCTNPNTPCNHCETALKGKL
ncbi:MAG: hypothetical protein NWF03_01455 [Candidatus Bathyarchaeota archaeon]|nr:hypothetical protein [Candidatus Bathyarchaeota archaeon]